MKHKKLSFAAALISCLAFASVSYAAPVYPNAVANYSPGSRQDFSSIIPGRAHADYALGAPQDNDNTPPSGSPENYVSLGFGGSVTLQYPSKVINTPGDNDIYIVETSYGNPVCNAYPEKARAYVSQDGVNWAEVIYPAGAPGCHNFYAGIPTPLFGWIQYIKIVDESSRADFSYNGASDGFDLDGVTGVTAGDPIIPGCKGGVSAVFNFLQGTTKGNGLIPAIRSVSDKARVAQMTDGGSYNFASLGFKQGGVEGDAGGEITVEFEYTQFDQAGPDIAAYETSFGDAPSRLCKSYPEHAAFYGSDNVDGPWTQLEVINSHPEVDNSLGLLCRDGYLNIGSEVAHLRFVRIVDYSKRNSFAFPSLADGYDVDGLVGRDCFRTSTNGNRRDGVEPTGQIDELLGNDYSISVAPNPAKIGAQMDINFEILNAGVHSITVYDVQGKQVFSAANMKLEEGVHTVPMATNNLKAGLYVIRISDVAGNSQAERVTITE